MRIDSKTMLYTDSTDSAARKKSVEKQDGLNAKIGAHNTQSVQADAVVISGKAKEASVIAKALKDLPEVRSDKVAELKAKLASGSYSVSGKTIAEKIVSSALNGLF